jgi:hypothetical protein
MRRVEGAVLYLTGAFFIWHGVRAGLLVVASPVPDIPEDYTPPGAWPPPGKAGLSFKRSPYDPGLEKALHEAARARRAAAKTFSIVVPAMVAAAITLTCCWRDAPSRRGYDSALAARAALARRHSSSW